MSDENRNSQDLGQDLAKQGGAASKKLMGSKAGRKAFGKIAKLLAKIMIKVIGTILKSLLWILGPWGIVILIAVICMLLVLNSVVKFFDWFSLGGERTEVQELFDKTLEQVLKDKHKEISSPLEVELFFPSDVISENKGLNKSDVQTNAEWISNAVRALTPSYTLSVAAFTNHVILDGDDWHKDYDEDDFESSLTGTDADFTSTPHHTDKSSISSRLKGVAKNKADVYISVGEKYGINPAFIAAVSMLESGNGGSYLATTHNNMGGITCASSNPLVSGCYTASTGRDWSYYDSVDKSIEHMAQIFKNVCKDNGRTTVYECWQVYSPPSDGNPHWGPDVITIMKQMTNNDDLYIEDGRMPGGGSAASGSDMRKDIEKAFEYYFNDPQLTMQINHSKETGETVTTKTKKVCHITEDVKVGEKTVYSYQVKTKTVVDKCRLVQDGYIIVFDPLLGRSKRVPNYKYECEESSSVDTVDVGSKPGYPEHPNYRHVISYRENKSNGYNDVAIYKSTVTDSRTEDIYEEQTRVETTTTGPTTKSLPSRNIATSVSSMYLSGSINYKYKETPYREVSAEENGDCTTHTYKKYKVKVVDDSIGIRPNKDGGWIENFLTSTMPEGDKTKLVREKDLDFFAEMMHEMDKTLPTIGEVEGEGGGGGSGSYDYGNGPAIDIPISAGAITAPTAGRITTDFGPDTLNGSSRYHYGIDIAKSGTVPIVSVADGVISDSRFSSSYGNLVKVKHNIEGKQWESLYGHMRGPGPAVGTTVSKGQQIGLMGNTGYSFGQHLHFELHSPHWTYRSSGGTAVNPLNYFTVSK
ncbi:peptidoglycan DD-metalloendopeptidase family protein (plasmid) [Rossellomorea sp. AcN35-11]|nr:peptidoglycan DD-metalloendopeptidase family protein [Rossellomorea aquimaris]WJV32402.1 peptidoglycan DD-metalloendopeptidase family protein [Rossellomorea sp. AcN35-11]